MKKELNIKMPLLYGIFYMDLYIVTFMFTSYLSDLGYETEVITSMLSLSNLYLLLCKPFYARLADKGKCRRLILAVMLGVIVSCFLMFHDESRSIWKVLIYSLFAVAATRALMDVIDAWMIKLAVRYGGIDYGKARAFGSLTYALTGLIYGWLISVLSYRIVLYCTLAASVAFLIMALNVEDPPAGESSESSLSQWRDLFKDKTFVRLLVFDSLIGPVCFIIDNFVPLLIRQAKGGTFETGLASFVMCMMEFVIMRHFSRLTAGMKMKTVYGISMFGFGIKALLLALMRSPGMMVASCVSQAFSFCLYQPAKIEIIKKEIGPDRSAAALSILSICSNIVLSLLFTPAAGMIADSYSARMVFVCFGSAALLFGTTYLLVNKKRDH